MSSYQSNIFYLFICLRSNGDSRAGCPTVYMSDAMQTGYE